MNMSWLADLTQLEPFPPLVLAPALGGMGVLLLLFGWHIYRVLFVAMAVLAGGALGAGAGFLLGVPTLILALPLGIVGALPPAFRTWNISSGATPSRLGA